MPDVILQLWKFDRAPAVLQRLVPQADAGWWLALIDPGGAEEVVELLVHRWTSSGYAVVRCDLENKGVVFALRSHDLSAFVQHNY